MGDLGKSYDLIIVRFPRVSKKSHAITGNGYDMAMSKTGFLILGVLVGILLMLPLTLHAPSPEAKSRAPQVITSSVAPAENNLAHVVRAVDGDTLVVTIAGKEERVRMLGINAPESVDPKRPVQCYGPEASKRMHTLADGKDAVLVPEPKDDRDTFGRLLRFVEIGGTDIGAEMIAEGYAENYCSHYPHPRCSAYDTLQAKAMQAGAGMWTACAQ